MIAGEIDDEAPRVDGQDNEVHTLDELARLAAIWNRDALEQSARAVVDLLHAAGCPREKLAEVAAPLVLKAYAVAEHRNRAEVARIEAEITRPALH